MRRLHALRKNGHSARREAPAAALWLPNGGLSATDGPYAETKEMLGGLFVRVADEAGHDEQFTACVGAGDR
jgi:hypothetical protein